MKERPSRNCQKCGKQFFKEQECSEKRWLESRKFCSNRCAKLGNTFRRGKKHPNIWNEGIPMSPEMKKHLSKKLKVIAKQKGYGKWMKGKKASLESRQKNSEAMKKRVAEGKHNFYIDGRTPKNHQIRMSLEYKLWREAVFKRDDWTCQWCFARNGNGKKVVLNADHIQEFAYHPELRFAIDNGRTLCRPCHYKRHSNQFKE